MGTAKSQVVRIFLDAAEAAYSAHVDDPQGQASVTQIFGELRAPLIPRDTAPGRLAACSYLEDVSRPSGFSEGPLHDLFEAFRRLEPSLTWYPRSGDTTNANDAYKDGHANAMIVGPGGLVPHQSVWLGVSLLAPGVRYPDHTHPPEETYLVLSEGDFFQDGRGWFTPGIGGTFYNPPGILHAMRSGKTPLFAMWALKAR